MANRFLTLNVGASQAVLAEYSVGGKGELTLMKYGMAPLAPVDADTPGAMESVLTPAIHAIMRECGIKAAPVIVSLNGQSVFPRFAKVPSVGDAEKLDQIVRYEVEQNVPFPMDEIVWNYQSLGQTPEGDQATIVVAAKLEHVRGVTNSVIGAGLSPEIVDVAPMAVYNAFKFGVPDSAGCNVVLDIGSRATALIIIEDEKVYIRSINVGGNSINKEISQAFGCSLEDAEQLKRERGYVALGGVTEDPDEVTDRVSKVIRGVMTRLHAEVSRSVNFYRSQQGGSQPSRLLLTGGTSMIPQLDEFFRESLQVEVEYLNPFGSIGIAPSVDAAKLESEALTLNESVGLALRKTPFAQMTFNLMPPEIVEGKRAAKRIPFLIAGAVFALAALGIGIVSVKRDTEVYRAQNGAVEAQRDTLSGFDKKIKDAQRVLSAESDRADELARLLASRPLALMRLEAVRRSLLPGMWIREWKTEQAKASDEAQPVTVNVVVRGWKDELDKSVKADASSRGGKARTAAEIVLDEIKGKPYVLSATITGQTDVGQKNCLDEFTMKVEFGMPQKEESRSKGKKGGRK